MCGYPRPRRNSYNELKTIAPLPAMATFARQRQTGGAVELIIIRRTCYSLGMSQLAARKPCPDATKRRSRQCVYYDSCGKVLWEGSFPLKETFWWYVVAYGVLLNFVTSLLFFALLINEANAALGTLAFATPIPYNIFVVVAVWRSAGRYPGRRNGRISHA